MVVNVYLRNLKGNNKDVIYGELWKSVVKISKKRLSVMTIEEKVSKAQTIVNGLNELLKKRYWGNPTMEYYVKEEE